LIFWAKFGSIYFILKQKTLGFLFNMQELPLLHRPPQQLLEAGHSTDLSYQFAMGLIQEDSTSLQQAEQDLDNLPLVQEHSEEWPSVSTRVLSVNQMLPRVKQYVMSYLNENKEQTNKPFQVFDALISDEKPPKKLYLSRREYQIAVAQIAFRYFANGFKKDHPSKKKIYYQGLVYFGALHDFLVGGKTNLYIFLKDPEGQNLELLDKKMLIIGNVSEAEMTRRATRHVFEGNEVERGDFLDKQKYVILYPSGE